LFCRIRTSSKKKKARGHKVKKKKGQPTRFPVFSSVYQHFVDKGKKNEEGRGRAKGEKGEKKEEKEVAKGAKSKPGFPSHRTRAISSSHRADERAEDKKNMTRKGENKKKKYVLVPYAYYSPHQDRGGVVRHREEKGGNPKSRSPEKERRGEREEGEENRPMLSILYLHTHSSKKMWRES